MGYAYGNKKGRKELFSKVSYFFPWMALILMPPIALMILPCSCQSDIPFPEVSFAANPVRIDIGESSNLSWSVRNADKIEINQGIGEVEESGSIIIHPDKTKIYTLTASLAVFPHKFSSIVHNARIDVNDENSSPSENIPVSDFDITNVEDGEYVAQIITLLGHCPKKLKDDIWIFVRSPNGYYYPQSINSSDSTWRTPKMNGSWETRIGLGQPEDVDKYFDIVLTTADSVASDTISDTLKRWSEANYYPGWIDLPPGVKEVKRLIVARSNEKWGPAPKIPGIHLSGEVHFTNVSNNATVPIALNIKGNCSSKLDGVIWVLVHATNGRWYPQSTGPCGGVHVQKHEQDWIVSGRFGGENNTNEPFDIVALLANDRTSGYLDRLQRDWCIDDYYPGLLTIELPHGLDEKERVRVYRN